MNDLTDQDKINELKKTYRNTTAIVIIMTVSLLFFPFLVHIMKMTNALLIGGSTDVNILRYIFFGIVILEFPFITLVNNGLLSVKSISNQPFSLIKQRLLLVTIITYAFYELIAILGLILFLLAGSLMDFYVFFFLALLFSILEFPKYPRWEKLIRKI